MDQVNETKELSNIAQVLYLTPNNIKFYYSEGDFLAVKFEDEEKKRITVPLSKF